MKYTTLGDTGMKISRLALGCMSFGSSEWRDWVLDEDASTEIIERAIDLGINFFDTANSYSWGESERLLGNILNEYDRDRYVIGTKVYFGVDKDVPNTSGLSRKAIENELSNSLGRLDVDTVDLYQIHRWDYDTAIKETLRALDDAVRRGQVRNVGASSMWMYQFADSIHTSAIHDLERFVSMQNHYNLTYREEEREMLPFCEREGIGVLPWSPLARGYLTRPDSEFETTTRGTYSSSGPKDYLSNRIALYRRNGGREINERVQELSEERGVTMAQLALSWLLHKEWVDAPIVGTSSVKHLEEAVQALSIDLSTSDLDYLEESYKPVPVDGHQ